MTPEELLSAVRAVVLHPPAGASDAEVLGALRAMLRGRDEEHPLRKFHREDCYCPICDPYRRRVTLPDCSTVTVPPGAVAVQMADGTTITVDEG